MIASVEVTPLRVLVRCDVGDHKGAIRVEARKSLDNLAEFETEPSLDWSGCGRRDVEYAKQFQKALAEACIVADQMQEVIASPQVLLTREVMGGGYEIEASTADYLIAVYILSREEDVCYMRGVEPGAGASKVVVNEAGLRALGSRIALEGAST